MIINKIPLESFIPQEKVSIKIINNELLISPKTQKDSQTYLPNKYKLPFRIDMTVKIDAPQINLAAFSWIVGKGYITFASNHKPRVDIITGENKPSAFIFENHIPINEYTDISVIYGKKAMQVIINNKICHFADDVPYLKLLNNNSLPDEFADGLSFAIVCDKRAKLTIKSMTVTEYEEDEPEISADINKDLFKISALSKFLINLPTETQDIINKIDGYLMKDTKKALKIKRSIDNAITYISPLGFRYKIRLSDDGVISDIGRIGYNAKWLQEKHGGISKVPDLTNAILDNLTETSPEFADKIYNRIKSCSGCAGDSSAGCTNRIKIEYNEKIKSSCGGSIQFKLTPSDFDDFIKVMDIIINITTTLDTTV